MSQDVHFGHNTTLMPLGLMVLPMNFTGLMSHNVGSTIFLAVRLSMAMSLYFGLSLAMCFHFLRGFLISMCVEATTIFIGTLVVAVE